MKVEHHFDRLEQGQFNYYNNKFTFSTGKHCWVRSRTRKSPIRRLFMTSDHIAGAIFPSLKFWLKYCGNKMQS